MFKSKIKWPVEMGVNWRLDEWKKVINIRSLKLKLLKHTKGATILFIQ